MMVICGSKFFNGNGNLGAFNVARVLDDEESVFPAGSGEIFLWKILVNH